MKNSMWGWAGIAAATVLIIFIFFKPGSSTVNIEKTPAVATSTAITTVAKAPAKTVVKSSTPAAESFTNIFTSKGSYECNYEEITPSYRNTNTIYFSDGKMRAEFRKTGVAGNIMVYDGKNMYVWVEGQSVGIVSVPKSIADFPAIIPKDITAGTVLGSGLNSASWSCHAWSKVPSLLEKPTYVKF